MEEEHIYLFPDNPTVHPLLYIHTMVDNPLLSVAGTIMSYPPILPQIIAMLTAVAYLHPPTTIVTIPHYSCQQGAWDAGPDPEIHVGPTG